MELIVTKCTLERKLQIIWCSYFADKDSLTWTWLLNFNKQNLNKTFIECIFALLLIQDISSFFCISLAYPRPLWICTQRIYSYLPSVGCREWKWRKCCDAYFSPARAKLVQDCFITTITTEIKSEIIKVVSEWKLP